MMERIEFNPMMPQYGSLFIGYQGDHNRTDILFNGLTGNDNYLKIQHEDGTYTSVPIPDFTFPITATYTEKPGTFKCQIMKLIDGQLVANSPIFSMRVAQSIPYNPEQKEVVPPNFQTAYDEMVDTTKDIEQKLANGEFIGPEGPAYEHSEEFTQLSEQVRADAVEADKSAAEAKSSEDQSAQNLSDLLNTIGTSVPSLVEGKIPMSQIPATATTDIFEVSRKEDLVNLEAQKGDLGELIELVNGERTVTKTWQLLGTDPKILDNWVVWGTSYAVQSGSATIAETANNSERINNMRLVTMNYSDFQTAVKDSETLYAVDMEK